MSQFDDLMAGAGLPAFRRVLGDDATYTPVAGDPVATWCIFRHDSDLVGQYGERLESRLTAQLPVADVPEPQPGDSLTAKGKTYRVDQVISRNDLFVEVAIR